MTMKTMMLTDVLSTVPLFCLLTIGAASVTVIVRTDAFVPSLFPTISSLSPIPIPILHPPKSHSGTTLHAKKNARPVGGGGFGSSRSSASSSSSAKVGKGKFGRGGGGSSDLISTLNDDDGNDSKREEKKFSRTFVKTDQERLLNDLAVKSSRSIIGQAVSKSPDYGSPDMDPFWSLLPSLISTKFPNASDAQLKRVAGMIEFSVLGELLRTTVLEDDVISNPWRPHDELHAYMPGLGDTMPFLDPNQLDLCRQLSEHYDVIRNEYEALYENRFDIKGNDRFQSVTSMNCEIIILRLSFYHQLQLSA